jgi:hypothetical protein
MGVLTNGYRDKIGVFRTYGGSFHNNSFPQGTLGNYNLTGMKRNLTAGEGITDEKVGLPMGYVMKGWQMPQKAGMISARSGSMSVSPSGSMLMGYPIAGTAILTVSIADAEGQLIVSGTGTSTLTVSTNTPALTASISGLGSTTFTLSTNTPTLGAEANLTGETTLTIIGTITPYAIGIMEGTTEEAGLTNSGIANSVWSKVIEAGFTADKILRLVAAHAAGSATGLEGANPQFTGLDGVTLRIDGSYSAGTRTIDFLDGE